MTTDEYTYKVIINVAGIMVYRIAPNGASDPCTEMQPLTTLEAAEMWLLEQGFSMNENWRLFSAYDGLHVTTDLTKTEDSS